MKKRIKKECGNCSFYYMGDKYLVCHNPESKKYQQRIPGNKSCDYWKCRDSHVHGGSRVKYESSKPFPNGTEFMVFNDVFCCNCGKHKVDADGMPLPDNCKIEELICHSQLDDKCWPGDDVVIVKGFGYACLHFEYEGDEDKEDIMRQHRELIGRKEKNQ